MKVALSAMGKDLDCRLDERFGRCACIIVVETEDMSFKTFDNTYAAQSSGAGTQAAGFVTGLGVRCVLTGNCGPKAAAVFSAEGIPIVTGQHGVIRDVIEGFSKNLNAVPVGTGKPVDRTVPGTDEFSANNSPFLGGGMGKGGGGRCKGGGRGKGLYCNQTGNTTRITGTETAKQLKQQVRTLKQQLESVEDKIKELTPQLHKKDGKRCTKP